MDDRVDENDIRDADDLSVLYGESRAVLDHQIELVRSIDEKAMWLVRTAVVVTSVVVSGGGIAGTEFLAENWAAVVFAMLGVAALLFLCLWGSFLFATSRVPVGPGQAFRGRVLESDLDRGTTLRLLLHGYESWIEDARCEADGNASAFTTLLLSFVGAVSMLATSGLLVAVTATTDVQQGRLVVVGLGTTGLVLYALVTKTEVNS